MEAEADRLHAHGVFVEVELAEALGDPVFELALERLREGRLAFGEVAGLAGIGDEVIELAVGGAVAIGLARQDELVRLGAQTPLLLPGALAGEEAVVAGVSLVGVLSS